MKRVFYLLPLISIFLFACCEAEFDPKDKWTEQMMVYCLLDQDDDTSYVRIEKCFLGEGNAHDFAKIKDSIYYAPDELDVKLYSYWDWDKNTKIDTFSFNYSTTEKQSGDFYSNDNCPIYFCKTKGKLNSDMLYELVITNLKTKKIVKSQTYLLSNYEITTNTFMFTQKNESMSVIWTNKYIPNQPNNKTIAKQFQIDIRFNYTENGEIKHLDIPVAKVSNNQSSYEHNINVYMDAIVSGIKLGLKGKQNLKWYATNPFQIRINACDLSTFDYISINNATQNSLNYIPVYSNIEGAKGLFAARRTHIYKGFKDKEIYRGLKTQITNLGLGF